MKANLIEAIMGSIVLVIAGFFLVFVYNASTAGDKNGQILHARFDRADGLVVGSDVRLSGVIIGTVSSLAVDAKTYMARADLSIREDLKIPADSIAAIISESFLGGKYIAIIPGGEDDYLGNGEEFSETQSSISFEQLIGKFLFSDTDKDKPKG